MQNNIFALISIVLIFWSLCYSLGVTVEKFNVKVNYTRKVGHFSMFFIPSLIFWSLNIEGDNDRILLSILSSVIFFLSISNPIRTKIATFSIMHASIDRPEDRPHTLLWLFTQTLTGLLVLIVFYLLWIKLEIPIELLYLTILATTFGDGLAEPVGVKFGKHKYAAKGFFVDRVYHRTIEGSATVCIISLLCCLLFESYFHTSQLLVLAIIYPILVTLTEAKSPHTWDTPFIFLVGNSLVTGVYLL